MITTNRLDSEFGYSTNLSLGSESEDAELVLSDNHALVIATADRLGREANRFGVDALQRKRILGTCIEFLLHGNLFKVEMNCHK